MDLSTVDYHKLAKEIVDLAVPFIKAGRIDPHGTNKTEKDIQMLTDLVDFLESDSSKWLTVDIRNFEYYFGPRDVCCYHAILWRLGLLCDIVETFEDKSQYDITQPM